jgi:2'-5' RNA ligase
MSSITTIAMRERNYVEWHGGITQYGFWCVEIEADNWLQRLKSTTTAFSGYLQAGYQRFPHITIATVGLMDEVNWDIVEQQCALLQALNLPKITLCWQGVASYQHCPIISVTSENNSLLSLRDSLLSVSSVDNTANFDAHITLGYYAKNRLIEDIEQYENEALQIPASPLLIHNIKFCTYQTDTIKGPINGNKVSEVGNADH